MTLPPFRGTPAQRQKVIEGVMLRLCEVFPESEVLVAVGTVGVELLTVAVHAPTSELALDLVAQVFEAVERGGEPAPAGVPS